MKLVQIVATFGLVLSAHAAPNLITNGSFEQGDFNNLDSDPRPEYMLLLPGMTNLTGWTIQGVKGVHWTNIGGAANSTDGLFVVDLQGLIPDGQFSSLSTAFPTLIGQTYRLTFDAFTGNVPNSATVSVGSLNNQSFTGGGPGVEPFRPQYISYGFNFVASASTSTLTFRVTSSDGFGPQIDNVSVSAVPETSSGIIMLIGLVTISTLARSATTPRSEA